MIWSEKYRPQRFEDVVGLPHEIPNSLSNLPHFLFIGKPGTGKTTTAKIIIKKLKAEHLLLNASDERGIQTIRDKVKTFAMTKSSNGKLKVVFLDEADYLTPEAQTSLRGLIEAYHTNCRFILTGNYENRIIDPLKSRLTTFRFESDDTQITSFLDNICTKELLQIDGITLFEIVKRNKGDIRKCVNQLQRLSELKRPITIEDINKEGALPESIHNMLKARDFIKARQTLLDANIEYDVFLSEYHQFVVDLCINKKQLTGPQFADIIHLTADAISKINYVISKEIIVESWMLKMLKVVGQ